MSAGDPLIVGPAVGMNQQQLAYLISIDLITCGMYILTIDYKHVKNI
ncbi:hypothetical protein GCM10011571_34280 [Marinithermofilum abyssi]|uniref:Uncharacterized protein n=1 Tax=Marinithermofilum abyssi TaxID=1571185 RepID=A0A8J2VKL9_9BACL|nr:hypothetical protein [Marinithermofilum abyssi]GGE29292.1 hypothetical protein GCM10011571_34280 [Marinithermofilum abyssi]